MPGKILKPVRKTLYDFSSLPANGTVNFTIAKNIDVSSFPNADIVLRTHSVNTVGSATPTIKLFIYTEAPSPEDPGQEFIFGNANSSSIGPVAVGSSVTGPLLNLATLTKPFGAFLRLVLQGLMGGTAATTF